MPINLLGAEPRIALELDRPSGPYHPGDVVHAAVTLHSDKEAKISGLRVGLLAWEESLEEQDEGLPARRSTVDEMVAVQALIDETTLELMTQVRRVLSRMDEADALGVMLDVLRAYPDNRIALEKLMSGS